MRKILLILMITLVLTGCTVVRIDTNSIDNIIGVILSQDNNLYNKNGKGYKYYVPNTVNYIESNELNEKLYSNGIYYYLYIDIVSYYYNTKVDYEVNKDAYYSKKIDIDGKKGYLEINKQEDNTYFIEFMYNYAKIEVITTKDQINDVVLNSSYILSTIKFNKEVIKVMLDDDFLVNIEEKYDIFASKKETDNFLKYNEEE
ncbi:MAG TPA: lipoprotein [Tenericutes bacterium]|nr:lipoprotein [Mycoplasmatota bacterium]